MAGLAAHLLAVAARQALLGRTFAGADVLLEPMPSVDIFDKTNPVICVYAGHGETPIIGKDLLSGTGNLGLRFEFLLPPQPTVVLAGQEVTFEDGSGFSVLFAALWRQVEIVLTTDQTAWAGVFRDLALRYKAVELASEIYEFPGAKRNLVPVRAIELTVDPLAEPPVGQQPVGVWRNFLDVAANDPGGIRHLAPFYEALMVGGPELERWRIDQSILGDRTEALRAIGVAPPVSPEDADRDLPPPPYDIEAPATPPEEVQP